MYEQVTTPDGRHVRLPRHGTRERYQHRRKPCSCADCRAANARYQAGLRRRHANPGVVQLSLLELDP